LNGLPDPAYNREDTGIEVDVQSQGAYTEEVSVAHEISPEAIIAFAVVDAVRSRKKIEIADLSGLFFEIRRKGLDEVEKVALRRLPEGGYYSDDVEAFLGRLLAAGYAKARSPVDVEVSGVELCKEILQQEMESHPEALKKVAVALGFQAVLSF
jgi:hypothetical protein